MAANKISVIVPVYRVERFLDRCISSITQQTYTNIEIILIDDASPDNSGLKCDEYAVKDERIKVLHKEHEGVSAARNAGLAMASGEFIAFVDCDDWLDLDILQVQLAALLEHSADVLQTAHYYAYAEENIFYPGKETPNHILLLNNPDTMKELIINTRLHNFVWGKLFKKSIIADIQFDKNIALYEDLYWMNVVLSRSQITVLINSPKYYYRQRTDSAVQYIPNYNLARFRALIDRYALVNESYHSLLPYMYGAIAKECITAYRLLLSHRTNANYDANRAIILDYLHKNLISLKIAPNLGKRERFELSMLAKSPTLLKVYWWLIAIKKIIVPTKLPG